MCAPSRAGRAVENGLPAVSHLPPERPGHENQPDRQPRATHCQQPYCVISTGGQLHQSNDDHHETADRPDRCRDVRADPRDATGHRVVIETTNTITKAHDGSSTPLPGLPRIWTLGPQRGAQSCTYPCPMADRDLVPAPEWPEPPPGPVPREHGRAASRRRWGTGLSLLLAAVCAIAVVIGTWPDYSACVVYSPGGGLALLVPFLGHLGGLVCIALGAAALSLSPNVQRRGFATQFLVLFALLGLAMGLYVLALHSIWLPPKPFCKNGLFRGTI